MTTPVGSSTSTQHPTTALSGALAGAGGAMGKDQFVKLLIAQMKNQDPMNPMDGTEMAAQLAQFSSVEQLMNIGTKLDAQASGNATMVESMNRNAALGMIGRTVTAVSDEVSVSKHTAGPIRVDVPGNGGHLVAHILNAKGQEIAKADYGVLSGGTHSLDLSSALKSVPDGSFTVRVDNVDSAGKATPMTPIQDFRIDGLHFGTNGAVLTSGNRTVPIGYVIGVASN